MAANRKKAVSLDLETEKFDAAVSLFLGRLLPEAVDQAVRKMAFDIVDETAKGLNGLGGLPKRIDTGRLRAGWRVALEDGGLPVPPSVVSSSASVSTDGSAKTIPGRGSNGRLVAGKISGVIVRNNVEYAKFVEHGTETMAPGKHLERAMREVRNRLPRETGSDSFQDRVRRAWNTGRV